MTGQRRKVIRHLNPLLVVMGLTVNLSLFTPLLTSCILSNVTTAIASTTSSITLRSISPSISRSDSSSNSSVQSNSHNSMLNIASNHLPKYLQAPMEKVTSRTIKILPTARQVKTRKTGTMNRLTSPPTAGRQFRSQGKGETNEITIPVSSHGSFYPTSTSTWRPKDTTLEEPKRLVQVEQSKEEKEQVTTGRSNGHRRSKKSHPVSYFLDPTQFPGPSITSGVGSFTSSSSLSSSFIRGRRDGEQFSYSSSISDSNHFDVQHTGRLEHMPKSLSLSTSGESACPEWHSSSTMGDVSTSGQQMQQQLEQSDQQSDPVSTHQSIPQAHVNCSCYDFDDGLFIECPNSDVKTITSSLESIRVHNLNNNNNKHPVNFITIKSYTIYNMDPSVTQLPGKLFSAIKQIKKIRISDTSITGTADDSFIGLESQLESLAISSSKLTSVPQKALSTLRSLDTLDLDSNQITEINAYSFYGLPLVSLNLQSNQISHLQEYSFGGLENSLQELILIGNLLNSFPLSALRRLKNLRTLKLNENKITTISSDEFTRFPYMSNLDLRSNLISHLQDNSFVTMPNLVSLSLASNKISTIDEKVFSHLTNLESLDLSKNYLRLLNGVIFSSLSKLRSIDLSNNHIHYIEMGTFHNLPQLRELFLTKNNLRSLLNGTFYNTTQIRSLFLEHNSLELLDSGVFSSLNHLYQLHLSYNQLTQVPVNLFKFNQELRSVSLDNNWIESLKPGTFDNLVELRDLRLHKNSIRKISRLDFKLIPNLQELHLQHNAINSIEVESFKNLVNLEYLDLQGNRVDSFNHPILSKFPTNLKYLHLSNNQISRASEKSLEGQSLLEILWLDHNNLTHVTRDLLSNLTSLEKLFLSHNQITRIEGGSFESLKNLKQLNLEYNGLEHLDELTLKGMSSLELLDLSFNPIKSVDGCVFGPVSGSLRRLMLQSSEVKEIKRSWFFTSNWIESQGGVGPGGDWSYTYLETLVLSGGRVEKIEPFSLASLTALKNLDLKSNSLQASSLIQSLREGKQLIKKNRSHHSAIRTQVLTEHHHATGTFSPSSSSSVTSSSPSPSSTLLFNCTLQENEERVNSIFPNQIENLFLSGNNLSGLELSDGDTTSETGTGSGYHHKEHTGGSSSQQWSSSSSDSSSGTWNWRDFTSESDIFHDLNHLQQLDLSFTGIESGSFFTSPALTGGGGGGGWVNSRGEGPSGASGSKVNWRVNFPCKRKGDLDHDTPSNPWKSVQVINLSGNGVKFIPSSSIRVNNNLPLLVDGSISTTLTSNLSTSSVTFSNLKELYLDDNQLSSAPGPDVLKYHPRLHHLSLSGNNIKRIPGGSFKLNHQITTIDLSNNSLSVIDVASFDGLNESLETLNLSNNVMRSIPMGVLDGLSKLTLLTFENNWFPFIPNSILRSTSLTSIKSVSFKNNPLTRIREDATDTPGSSMEYLTSLSLEGGNLTVIASHDLTPFSRLKELNLRKNQILKISPGSFRKMSQLQHLDLSVNRLELLPEERLSSLSNLRHLNLSKNHLSEMPSFSPDLKAISVIDVSGNRLTRIDSFGHLAGSVEEIFLQDNMVAWISGSALANLTSLRKLDLRSNFLTHIPESLLTPIEVSLEGLYITGNPFHCDCRLLSLWEWVQEHSRVLPQKDREADLICVQSEPLPTLVDQSNGLQDVSSLSTLPSSSSSSSSFSSSSFSSSSSLVHSAKSTLTSTSTSTFTSAAANGKVSRIVLSTLHPVDFCPVPLISRIEVTKIESSQLSLSWHVQNDSLVGGFNLDQYMSSDHRNAKSQKLNSNDRSTTLTNLHPETEYTICIEANGRYIRSSDGSGDLENREASYVFGLHRSYGDNYITSNRKCVQARTHTEVGTKQMIIFFNKISLTGLIVVAIGVTFAIAITSLVVGLMVKWKNKRQSRRVKQQENGNGGGGIDGILQMGQSGQVSELSQHQHQHQHQHQLQTSQSIHQQLHQVTSAVGATTMLPDTITVAPDDFIIDPIDSVPLPLPLQSQLPEEFITYRHFALPTHECMYNNGWTANDAGPCEHMTQIT